MAVPGPHSAVKLRMTDPESMSTPDDARRNATGGDFKKEFAHALLFTGHMIDGADRRRARFPAWAEGRARAAIHAAIAGLVWEQPGATVGLAGAASGGDLLFHECCAELGILTRVLLALPPEEFKAISVAPAGADWVRRFDLLLERAGVCVLQETDGVAEGATDNIWQRANLWMVEQASRLAEERALLALWDGKTGDGPGGTAHFLETARACGIRVPAPIEMRALLRSSF